MKQANADGNMAPIGLLDAGVQQTFHFQKNAVSVKPNKTKHNKIRSSCNYFTPLFSDKSHEII